MNGGPIPDNLAILFGPPVNVVDSEPIEQAEPEDVYTKYGKYTKNQKDKKFLENCFITTAAGEVSGLFPMLMALACAVARIPQQEEDKLASILQEYLTE